MDINKILNDLGIDFSTSDAKRGAVDAIAAILSSRNTSGGGNGSGSMPGGGEFDVEIDPDLLQPSIKHSSQSDSDSDFDIEDEDDVLSQVKHNQSDDPGESASSGQGSGEGGEDEEESTDTDSSASGSAGQNDAGSQTDTSDTVDSAEPTEAPASSSEENSSSDESEDSSDDTIEDGSKSTDDVNSEDELDGESTSEDSDETNAGSGGESSTEADTEDGDTENDGDAENDEPDEEDFIDSSADSAFQDKAIKAKQEARKIKRERTLAAAKKALADAQARKVAPSLISELEKSIEALEALTESIKSIKDISDEEFNQLVNRVFDAIDAVGDKSLTFSSEEERAAKVKEIQNDLSSAQTQMELSAEDAAKIRAETQAIKARQKEIDKYKVKSRGAFKGFQDFLNSLYRAVALQVSTEETRDDTWSAISRRNSGANVLHQGKKINELPNKKIPVIDFYFDQSGSWDEDDIKIGEKAVQSLADMEEKGDIKINIYYFSNHVHTDAQSARNEGGTRAWNDIVKNVISTQATNVIIMTDSDMEYTWGETQLKYTVPGYVWYLWKNGDNAPRLPRDLKGRGGTQQFSFKPSEM